MRAQNSYKIKFFKTTCFLLALILPDKIFLLFGCGITLYIMTLALLTIPKEIYWFASKQVGISL